MPLNDPKKPLPTIVRQGVYPDTIEFSLPDGTTGFAVVISRPVGMACDVTAALIERYNQHNSLGRDLTAALDSALQYAKESDEALARVKKLNDILIEIESLMLCDDLTKTKLGTILRAALK